jgi:hypothetical protein
VDDTLESGVHQGGLTNGQKGLLQYHKFLFSLGKTIQPLAIQVTDGPFVSPALLTSMSLEGKTH